MTVRVVFFDMGNTLTTMQPGWDALFVRVARAHGLAVDEAAVERAYTSVFARLDRDPAIHMYDATADYDARYWRGINGAVLREAGVPPDVPITETLVALHRAFDDPAHYHLYPDAVPTLRALRESGYRLGIVSNWSWNLPELCAGLGIAGYFDEIITSARVGASKPHRAIFDRALEALGVAPAEAIHVGDNPLADATGARAAGLHAILVAREEYPPAAAGTPYVAHALAEVPDFVARIASARST